MADRYWVGGTGTWSSTNTVNWSANSGGTGGASVPTAADDVFFNADSNVGTGAFTVTMANVARVCRNITISGLDGAMTLAGTAIGLTVSGSLSFPATNFSRTYTGTTLFNATTTGNTITTNGVSFGAFSINGVGGEWTLGSALTVLSGSTTTLTNGTLNLGGFTLSTGIFSSNNSNVRAINFGTGNIALTSTVAATTVLSMSSATNLTVSGTGGFTRNQAASATVTFGITGGSVARAPNFRVTAGNQDLTVTDSSWFKDLNFTGSTCAIQGFTNVVGVLTLSASGTYTSFVPTFRVTATLDTLGRTLFGFGVNGTGITVSLAGTVTCGTTGTLTLTGGTLNLNGFDVSVGIFSSSGTTARSLSFGSNNITLTGGTGSTILSCAAANNFTWTGTGRFIRNQTSTATVVFGTTGGSSSNAINLTVNAGASTLTITGGSTFKELIFTGSTCSVSGSPNVYGNVTLASGGTYTAFTPVFVGTSIVTSSGKVMGGIGINSSGASLTLADAMSVSSFILTNGTLFLAGFSLSSTGSFATGAGTKNITFDGGTIAISATTSAWNNVNPTGFTTTAGTGTGIISMTAATAKTFVGGGSTYNCRLNQGGAGTLNITGSNTFNDIGNTTQPASVLFTAGSTNTFSNFSLSGTSGNLITIGSQTAAAHTLSKASGVVSVSFCSISNSSATGGASWQAYTVNGNVDGGNNTGWSFAAAVIYNVSISELSQISEIILGNLLAERNNSEAANALDSIAAEPIKFGIINEFANALDSVISNETLFRTIDEEAIGIDSIDEQLIAYRSIDEIANGLDEFNRLFIADRYIDEDAAGLDSVEKTSLFYEDIAEFANAQDTQVSNLILDVLQSESAQASDEVISVQIYPKSLSEQANIDSFNDFQVVLGISFINETANIESDNSFVYGSFPVNINELAVGADASSFVYGSFPVNISETALAVDSVSKQFTRPVSVVEGSLIEDSSNFVFGSIPVSISESTAISSLNNFIYASFNVLIAESAIAVDSVNYRFGTFPVSVAETAASTGSFNSRSGTFRVDVSESAVALEAFSSRFGLFRVSVSETAQTLDLFNYRFGTIPVQVAENATLLDQASWVYYWSIVVDTQTANWQNVVDTQSPTWVTVQDTQTPSWQNVTDTQSPSWSNVGTNQTPNWQQIN